MNQDFSAMLERLKTPKLLEKKRESPTKKSKKSTDKAKKPVKSNRKPVAKPKIENKKEEIRKWEDAKNKEDLKKGAFSNEEHDNIVKLIFIYASSRGIKPNELVDFLVESRKKSDDSIWLYLGSKIANRSIQSIHNFCRRKFDPSNNKGKWTKQEENLLLSLFEAYGPEWKKISSEIGRTALNCRDKHRSLYSKPENPWNLALTLKMLKKINLFADTKFLKTSYKITKKVFEEGFFREKPDGTLEISAESKTETSPVKIFVPV